MSLNRLKKELKKAHGKRIKRSLFEVLKWTLYYTADNKQPMFPVPTLHCTLPFCIELCSVELLGSIVLEQHGSENKYGYDAEYRKFLRKRRL